MSSGLISVSSSLPREIRRRLGASNIKPACGSQLGRRESYSSRGQQHSTTLLRLHREREGHETPSGGRQAPSCALVAQPGWSTRFVIPFAGSAPPVLRSGSRNPLGTIRRHDSVSTWAAAYHQPAAVSRGFLDDRLPAACVHRDEVLLCNLKDQDHRRGARCRSWLAACPAGPIRGRGSGLPTS